MTRVVRSELLDRLPPADPAAIESRRDLRRLNWWMRSAAVLAQAWRSSWRPKRPERVIELGGGDGTVLLELLRRMERVWDKPRHETAEAQRVLLVDQHDLVAPETRAGLAELGWQFETVTADAGEWLEQLPPMRQGIVFANLFVHHFSAAQLQRWFGLIARRAELFVALEPRRGLWSRIFSHCVGLIGCGPVTRYDAPVSVQAGFAGSELSALWPAAGDWRLAERPAGWFGHLFVAQHR